MFYEYESSDYDSTASQPSNIAAPWDYRRTQATVLSGGKAELKISFPMIYNLSSFKVSYWAGGGLTPDSVQFSLSTDGGTTWGTPTSAFPTTGSFASGALSGKANAVRFTMNRSGGAALLYRLDLFGAPPPPPPSGTLITFR